MKSSGGRYKLERDADRPIRLTVQFYLCSDTNELTDDNVAEIAAQIRHIYDQGMSEGSLVVDGSVAKPGLPSASVPPRPTATTSTSTTYSGGHLDNSIL